MLAAHVASFWCCRCFINRACTLGVMSVTAGCRRGRSTSAQHVPGANPSSRRPRWDHGLSTGDPGAGLTGQEMPAGEHHHDRPHNAQDRSILTPPDQPPAGPRLKLRRTRAPTSQVAAPSSAHPHPTPQRSSSGSRLSPAAPRRRRGRATETLTTPSPRSNDPRVHHGPEGRTGRPAPPGRIRRLSHTWIATAKMIPRVRGCFPGKRAPAGGAGASGTDGEPPEQDDGECHHHVDRAPRGALWPRSQRIGHPRRPSSAGLSQPAASRSVHDDQASGNVAPRAGREWPMSCPSEADRAGCLNAAMQVTEADRVARGSAASDGPRHRSTTLRLGGAVAVGGTRRAASCPGPSTTIAICDEPHQAPGTFEPRASI